MISQPRADMLDEDDIYRTTSQFKHWSFTAKRLEDLRNKTNKTASISVRTAIQQSHAENADRPSIVRAEVDCLTVEEERTIVTWYCNKAMDLCDYQKQYGFGKTIKATAVQFMNRFYLMHSPMTYHPKKMMLSAIYLATKVENVYLNVEEFAKMVPKTTADDILAPEFLMSQGFQFIFDVRHPFRALEGALMELQAIGKGEYLPPYGSALTSEEIKERALAIPGADGRPLNGTFAQRVERAYNKAKQILLEGAQLTEAYFLYTPAQILMSAWLAADKPLAVFYLDVQLSGLFAVAPSALGLRLTSLFESCAALMCSISATRKPDDAAKAEAIRIDKKLYKCRNPQKVDISGIHRAAKEGKDIFGADGHKDKKRRLEREQAQKEEQDLFGGNLKP